MAKPTKDELWADIATLKAIIDAHVSPDALTERERTALEVISREITTEHERVRRQPLFVGTEYDF